MLAVVDSGTSSSVFERLLQIFRESSENTRWISSLITPMVSQDRILRALHAVLEKGEEHYEVAIKVANDILCKTDTELDHSMAMSVLVAGAGYNMSPMADYYWGSLAARLFEMAPDFKLELFRQVVDGTVDFGGMVSGGKMSSAIYQICKEEPSLTWPILADALSSDRAYLFRMWLGEDSIRGEPHPPAITAFNPSDIFSWIDEDRLERAPKMPEVLPKTLNPSRGGQLTKDFLDRYLDIEGISYAVMAFFDTGAYSGPRSQYLSERRTRAQKWMAEVGTSSVVADWLEDYVQKLSKEIDNSKMMEERGLR